MRPPGLTRSAARASTSSWALTRCSSAPGRTRHLASGLRRQAPTPVQGASMTTRSTAPARSARTSASPHAGCAPPHCGRRHVPGGHGSAQAAGYRCLSRPGGRNCASAPRARASCRRRRRTDPPRSRRAARPTAAPRPGTPRPGFRSARRYRPVPHGSAGSWPRPRARSANRRATTGVGTARRWASAASAVSRSPLSVLTRRSTGARHDSAAPSAARSSPNTAEKCGSSHSG